MAKPLDRIAKPLDQAKMWAIANGYISPDGTEVRLTAIQNALTKLEHATTDGAVNTDGVLEACTWLRTGLPTTHPDHLEPEQAQKIAPMSQV